MAEEINEQSPMGYFLDPTAIRKMGLEKHRNTRDKCFESHPVYRGKAKEEMLADRQQRWDDVRDSIAHNAFDPKQPIAIMLNRKMNKSDQIFQWHHRLAIAIGLQLREISVQFVTKKK